MPSFFSAYLFKAIKYGEVTAKIVIITLFFFQTDFGVNEKLIFGFYQTHAPPPFAEVRHTLNVQNSSGDKKKGRKLHLESNIINIERKPTVHCSFRPSEPTKVGARDTSVQSFETYFSNLFVGRRRLWNIINIFYFFQTPCRILII